MRQSTIAFVLLALVTSTWAVGIMETIPQANVYEAHIPKMLLTEIAERIASEGPLDDIFKTFDTLESQIRKEQVEHDSLSAKQANECKLERDFRAKEIGDASSALGRATDEKNACQSSLTENQQMLKSNLKTQTDIKANIAILDETRQAEKKVYDDRHKKYVGALRALDGGHKILSGLYAGEATLIDVSKVTTDMFKDAVALRKTEHYVGIIGALAQISAKSEMQIDNNILKRVEDLFNLLREKLTKEMKAEEAVESASVKTFEVAKDKLVQQLKGLVEREKTLRDNISNYEQCIVKANNIISQATTKKERNQGLLNEAEKMCKNVEAEYKTATSQRKEELSMIDKLRDLVGSKLKFSKGVNKRATQNKDQFKKYTNKAQLPKGRKGLGGGKKKALIEVEGVETA